MTLFRYVPDLISWLWCWLVNICLHDKMVTICRFQLLIGCNVTSIKWTTWSDFAKGSFGDMMTSSNGSIFRVTGHLLGNSLVTREYIVVKISYNSILIVLNEKLSIITTRNSSLSRNGPRKFKNAKSSSRADMPIFNELQGPIPISLIYLRR